MRRTWLLAAIALLMGYSELGAVRMLRVSVDDLAAQANGVFVGTVSGVSSHDSARGATTWSDYEVEIQDVLGGDFATSRLTLSFADGGPDGSGGGIVDVPKLELGQKYLIFWDKTPFVPCPAIGWHQGIFREVADPVLGPGETVFVSLEGRPLWVDVKGLVVLGNQVVVKDGAIVGVDPSWRDESLRVPDPTPVGGVALTPSNEAESAAMPPELDLVRPATLDDIRLLLGERR